MNLQYLFIGLGIIAVAAHVLVSILIMAALDRQGYPTNILLSRILILRYVSIYRELTRRLTGHTGILFYLWIGSINLTALAMLGAYLTR